MKIGIFTMLLVTLKLSFSQAQNSKINISVQSIFNRNVTEDNWLNTKYRVGSFGVNATYPLLKGKKITLATGISYQNLAIKISWGAIGDIWGESYVLELSRIHRFSIPLLAKYCINEKKSIRLLGIIEQSLYQNINRKQFVANDRTKTKSFISSSQESICTNFGSKNVLQLGLGIEKDITVAKRKYTISLIQLNDLESLKFTHANYFEDNTMYLEERTVKILSTCLKISTNIF